MGKKKKKPRKPDAPALSKLDTAIYIVWIGLCTIALPLGALWTLVSISNYYPAQNPNLLFCRHTGSIPLVIFSVLTLFPGFMISLAHFALRQPIFGRTDISYGYPYDASVYPLFLHSRQKRAPSAAARREHKRIRDTALGCIALFLLLFLAGSLCAAPRWELETNGSLVHYNCLNQPTHYGRGDLATVEFGTDYYAAKHSSGWRLRIFITTKDGHCCRIPTTQEFSKALVYKNALPSEIVTISGKNRVPDVVINYQEYRNWTEQEIAALYELFELPY